MSFIYVTEEGARINKRGGRIIIGRGNETVFEIPLEKIEGIVLIDSVQVTSQAISEFLRQEIPVTWLSGQGKFFGRLEPTTHVNVHKQFAQIQLFADPSFHIKIAKKLVLAKTHNQLTILRRYERNSASSACFEMGIKNIISVRKNLFQAVSLEEIMGLEGYIARCYFQVLGNIIDENFRFEKRSKRPPKDAFNSMLSFGYTLLMYEVYTAIVNSGLHPYFGFLHSLHNGHPALAFDLMEEWRAVLIDSMVLSLIQHHEVKIEDFSNNGEEEGVYMSRECRGIFIRNYSKKLGMINKYLEKKQSFREAINSQVELFSKAIINKEPDIYEPFTIR